MNPSSITVPDTVPFAISRATSRPAIASITSVAFAGSGGNHLKPQRLRIVHIIGFRRCPNCHGLLKTKSDRNHKKGRKIPLISC
jgi:hypothetical protein